MKHIADSLLLVLIAMLILACQKQGKDSQESSDQLQDSINTRYHVLTDSIDNAWNVMIEDDNQKLQYMKRLLQEVSYMGSFSEKRYQELLDKVEKLKDIRYESKTAMTSRRIDQYDSATNEVSRQVINFAYGHPEFNKNGMMKELVNDIYSKNEMVLLYRVHYDAFAEARNELVDQHGALLDSGRFDVRKLPLFKIPPEEV